MQKKKKYHVGNCKKITKDWKYDANCTQTLLKALHTENLVFYFCCTVHIGSTQKQKKLRHLR